MLRKLFRKRDKFSPNLINLIEYEKSLLYQREHGKPAIPVMPIPDIISGWTDSELQAMRDNREEAEAIRRRIFPPNG